MFCAATWLACGRTYLPALPWDRHDEQEPLAKVERSDNTDWQYRRLGWTVARRSLAVLDLGSQGARSIEGEIWTPTGRRRPALLLRKTGTMPAAGPTRGGREPIVLNWRVCRKEPAEKRPWRLRKSLPPCQ
jgi:hypothetical protein